MGPTPIGFNPILPTPASASRPAPTAPSPLDSGEQVLLSGRKPPPLPKKATLAGPLLQASRAAAGPAAGQAGPLSVALAREALQLMDAQPDLKTRARLGHDYLSAISGLTDEQSRPAGNLLRIVTLDDPLSAQAYQTGLLQMLPAPTAEASGLRYEPTSASPAKSLFRHANGKPNSWWRKLLGRAPQHRLASLFHQAHDLLESTKSAMLKAHDAPSGSPERRVVDFHKAASDMTTRDRIGLQPLQTLLSEIDQIQDHTQLGAVLGGLHQLGIPALATLDLQMHERPMVVLHSNFGTPSSDLSRARLDRQYVQDVLEAAGSQNGQAESERIQVLAERLHKQGFDLKANVEFQSTKDWHPELGLSQYPTTDGVLGHRNMEGLLSGLEGTPLKDVKLLLRYSTLSGMAADLNTPMVEAVKSSNHRLGLSNVTPEQLTTGYLQPLVQEKFAQNSVSPEKEKLVREVFENVRSAFRERIQNADWYTPETRQAALQKLEAMKLEVGRPSEGFPALEAQIKPDDHLGNVGAIRMQHARMVLTRDSSLFGWGATSDVNAYHLPFQNKVVVTGAFLGAATLPENLEAAELYGVLGFALAHEIGHGYEAGGVTHDAQGASNPWLHFSDQHEFSQRVSDIFARLSSDEPALTESNRTQYGQETGADLVGISVAYEAFLKHNKDRTVRDGHTPEQRFFLHFASMLSRANIKDDIHPGDRFRVDTAAASLPAYAAAFSLMPGAPMAFKQGQRLGLW